jgi:hopene-associated glycosyltransferase HpnB
MLSTLLIIAGAVSVAAWIWLLTANGGFWRVRGLTLAYDEDAQQNARIVAVIPARNEAETIARVVSSLFAQQWAGELHIVLVDDNSTDGTAEAARGACNPHISAEQRGANVGHPTAQISGPHIPTSANCGQKWGMRSLTIVQGQPLPAGWSGKMWAVHQGVEEALKLAPDYLLFTDADIVHAPTSVASLVAKSESGFDLVSLMVRLHCRSFAERLLIPAFVFFFFMLYPPRWISDSRRKTAGAAGGCILIRPQALARAGGIAAIRSEIIDDCALAREVKRSGGRVWLGLADETASVRPYDTFGEIGRMIARTAFNQLGHSALMLVGALVGLTLVYLLPIALVYAQPFAARVLGALAWLLMALCFSQTVRFYRMSPIWALALPVSAAFYMGATLLSAINYWSGRGGQWKGRAQDVVKS